MKFKTVYEVEYGDTGTPGEWRKFALRQWFRSAQNDVNALRKNGERARIIKWSGEVLEKKVRRKKP